MSATESGDVIGVDTGGTFTDVTLLKPSGELVTGKSATTPGDFSVGVMNAVGEVAREMELSMQELLGRTAFFKHGTTVATNALITRSGARVGFITTAASRTHADHARDRPRRRPDRGRVRHVT